TVNNADFPQSPRSQPDTGATDWSCTEPGCPDAGDDNDAAVTSSWTVMESDADAFFYVNSETFAPTNGALNGTSGGGTANAHGFTHCSYPGGDDYSCPLADGTLP